MIKCIAKSYYIGKIMLEVKEKILNKDRHYFNQWKIIKALPKYNIKLVSDGNIPNVI